MNYYVNIYHYYNCKINNYYIRYFALINFAIIKLNYYSVIYRNGLRLLI